MTFGEKKLYITERGRCVNAGAFSWEIFWYMLHNEMHFIDDVTRIHTFGTIHKFEVDDETCGPLVLFRLL